MRHFLTEYRDSVLAFVGILIASISLGFVVGQVMPDTFKICLDWP